MVERDAAVLHERFANRKKMDAKWQRLLDMKDAQIQFIKEERDRVYLRKASCLFREMCHMSTKQVQGLLSRAFRCPRPWHYSLVSAVAPT
jgi:hypothetical protein